MAREGKQAAEPGARRLAEAARAARARAAPVEPRAPGRRRAGPMAGFGAEIGRRDVFRLLVLHWSPRRPAYATRLTERTKGIPEGVIRSTPTTTNRLLR